MSTHNKGFDKNLTKRIIQLSSNTHFISSSVKYYVVNITTGRHASVSESLFEYSGML